MPPTTFTLPSTHRTLSLPGVVNGKVDAMGETAQTHSQTPDLAPGTPQLTKQLAQVTRKKQT
eukprot:1514040-Prorocentrum_lima.AAC.1